MLTIGNTTQTAEWSSAPKGAFRLTWTRTAATPKAWHLCKKNKFTNPFHFAILYSSTKENQMKIQEAIDHLEELKNSGETDVIINWWSRTHIEDQCETILSDEDFRFVSTKIDVRLDWSDIDDQITKLVKE
jgi:hypothetical protein